jgi:hypothetical protein
MDPEALLFNFCERALSTPSELSTRLRLKASSPDQALGAELCEYLLDAYGDTVAFRETFAEFATLRGLSPLADALAPLIAAGMEPSSLENALASAYLGRWESAIQLVAEAPKDELEELLAHETRSFSHAGQAMCSAAHDALYGRSSASANEAEELYYRHMQRAIKDSKNDSPKHAMASHEVESLRHPRSGSTTQGLHGDARCLGEASTRRALAWLLAPERMHSAASEMAAQKGASSAASAWCKLIHDKAAFQIGACGQPGPLVLNAISAAAALIERQAIASNLASAESGAPGTADGQPDAPKPRRLSL